MCLFRLFEPQKDNVVTFGELYEYLLREFGVVAIGLYRSGMYFQLTQFGAATYLI